MKTVLAMIFLGLLAMSYGGQIVGNAINSELAKIDYAIRASSNR